MEVLAIHNMQNFNVEKNELKFLGYNDTKPSQLIPDGVYQKADNCYMSDAMISKVPGSTAVAPAIAAKTINGLASYEKISASAKYIVVNIDGASNAQLYKWTGSGSFSSIGSANLTNSTRMIFETAGDYLFGFNGVEEVDYDGTTVTRNRSGVPLGYFAKWFHNYLFVAGTSAYPNRLYWSDLGNPVSFTGSNYVDVNPGDSDQITGLGILQDELFVFKKNTIWSITGWSGTTFSATTILTQNTNARLIGYGTVSSESIVSTGNDIYFMSYLGSAPVIRSLKKTQLATTLGGGIVSTDIETTMGLINTSALSIISGLYDGRFIMFSVPLGSSTTNNKILVLDSWMLPKKDMDPHPWTTMTGKNAGHMIISTMSGSALPYFSSATALGKVYKIDSSVFTDDGSPVVMDVWTKDFMGEPSRRTKWKYLFNKYQTGSGGTLQIKARGDQAATWATVNTVNLTGNSPSLGSFILGTSILGGQQTSKVRTILPQLTCNMLGIEFYEGTSSDCVLYEYQIYGNTKGLRAS